MNSSGARQKYNEGDRLRNLAFYERFPGEQETITTEYNRLSMEVGRAQRTQKNLSRLYSLARREQARSGIVQRETSIPHGPLTISPETNSTTSAIPISNSSGVEMTTSSSDLPSSIEETVHSSNATPTLSLTTRSQSPLLQSSLPQSPLSQPSLSRSSLPQSPLPP